MVSSRRITTGHLFDRTALAARSPAPPLRNGARVLGMNGGSRSFAHAVALASPVLVAAVAACSPAGETVKDTLMNAPPRDAAAQGPDSASSEGGSRDAVADAPFHEQPHVTTTIPNSGGPVLAHPTLVTITYADDPERSAEEGLGAYLVGSPWLAAVGKEYGIGLGTHVPVELTEHAPSAIDDVAIQSLIGSLILEGKAPTPGGGSAVPVLLESVNDAGIPVRVDASSESDGGDGGDASPSDAVLLPAVYMLVLPAGTQETAYGRNLCDWTGGGYHSQAQGSYGGQTFVYAVVTRCPSLPASYLETVVSHEFIEACSDPSVTAPAYIVTDPNSVWTALGGEVGDLCSFVEPQWPEGGYTALQRVYSNASARAGGDPCLPSTGRYFATDVQPSFVPIQAGQTATFSVTGWSTVAGDSWGLSSTLYLDQPDWSFSRRPRWTRTCSTTEREPP